MKRGTTPTHTFTFPKYIRVTDFNIIYITYSQNDEVVLEKKRSDITIDDEKNRLITRLTQQDTLSFVQGPVEIQIRASDGTNAIASDPIETFAEKILKEGVI